MRALPKWVGETDDSPIPARVRIRVFERYGGVCQLSGRKIRPGDKWEAHHALAISLGGTNSEDNLVPVLVDAHKEQTRTDMRQKSKNYRVRRKHLGIRKPSRFACARNSKWRKKLNGEVVPR